MPSAKSYLTIVVRDLLINPLRARSILVWIGQCDVVNPLLS